ncbi:MAG: hypothetical protein IRY92_06805, partial [Dactylosporangium sp.]|nr:hypothetical protein [Dactylosporangium sp.]
MHDILDEAIGPSPVSTVDVDRVIAAGRRRTRLRRLLLVGPAVGCAAAVTAVIALALTTAGGPSTPPSTPIEAQPGTQLGSPPYTPSGAAPIRPGETPDQIRQR